MFQIDPKRAVPRGPGQQAVISQQSVGGPPSVRMYNSYCNKILVNLFIVQHHIQQISAANYLEALTCFYLLMLLFWQKDSGNNENKIFVGGLGGNATEEELRRFFSVFGKVQCFQFLFASDL